VSGESKWIGWETLVWVLRFGDGRTIFILSEELRDDAMWTLIEEEKCGLGPVTHTWSTLFFVA